MTTAEAHGEDLSLLVAGHLSELGLELWLADEVEDTERAAVEQHLASCPACAQRLHTAQTMQREFEQLPTPPALQQPANNTRWHVAGLLAAAAAIALFVLPWGADDSGRDAMSDFRSKGASVSMAVFVQDGVEVRTATTGDIVHAGDRLGFRYGATEDGHLMILGIDGAGAPYLCFPQEEGGTSEAVTASTELVTVTDAVRLDATPGTERIVALLCEAPFTFTEISADLVKAQASAHTASLPEVRAGCAQQEVALTKEGGS